MRSLVAILVLFSLSMFTVAAAITKLKWNAPAVAVAGHKLYEKLPPTTAGGPPVYSLIGSVTGATTEFILPAPQTVGPRTFVATAYDSLGQESAYSNEAILPAKPGEPVNLRITVEFTNP
jgi:hypothetical protein